MPDSAFHASLREFAKKLQAAVYELQSNINVAAYIGVVLGSTLLKNQSRHFAAMDITQSGIDSDFGKEPAGTFTYDHHPDLCVDFCLQRENEQIFLYAA
jgi:hypothetical protein